ncbi:hypothetical protein [Streptomyces iconiensis]|uniref:Secreted protein n=1 Tax=Streptomyces iconiensis TaxID=1384038 RepID=A0ABT6ZZV1_9ACTN|nr:hypothetical protein [Streptomyces iconiensis]MDJ1134319.1 hypothetical protein [Streptomyces iconiensis]
MRSGVTVRRACAYAVALVLSLLLAGAGTVAQEAQAAQSRAASVQESASPPAGETEQEHADCHARGAARAAAAPPVPGERPRKPWEPRDHAFEERRGKGAPATGSAGMPWRRSVGVPVLHQVFRH